MEISPRYDAGPIVVLDGVDPTRIVGPLVRQRRRLVRRLTELSDEQWMLPTRCDGWTAKEVVSHLSSTNGFWSFSVAGAVAGTPTRFLRGFDPKATPAALAVSAAAAAPADLLAELAASTEALCTAVEALTPAELSLTGEAPPGDMALHAVLHHALWDCWVHERDILLPLGLEPDEEADEVLACLRYAACLAPALTLTIAPDRRGVLAVSVTDPASEFHVSAGPSITVGDGPAPAAAPTLRGTAVDVLEALSIRQPLDVEIDDADRWLVDGLAEIFEEA